MAGSGAGILRFSSPAYSSFICSFSRPHAYFTTKDFKVDDFTPATGYKKNKGESIQFPGRAKQPGLEMQLRTE